MRRPPTRVAAGIFILALASVAAVSQLSRPGSDAERVGTWDASGHGLVQVYVHTTHGAPVTPQGLQFKNLADGFKSAEFGFFDDPGHFSSDYLEPGRYEVRVLDARYASVAPRVITLEASQRPSIRFVLDEN